MVPVGNQVSAINLFHVHLSTELGKFFKFGFFALNGFRRTSIQSEVRQVRGYDVCNTMKFLCVGGNFLGNDKSLAFGLKLSFQPNLSGFSFVKAVPRPSV